ncbi:asparaginase [Allonocardiopsis opalescens]|uniref:Asparaginase n=1 Tax=Allonocardiopsis opalescens TaxID=1144618 RepID=A0A2T0PW21_9ACTN|nr:asparaginase [Allonocardiopsis opalescens]PRX95721.1 asparaginase [Allonocardiopsis opalescens]
MPSTLVSQLPHAPLAEVVRDGFVESIHYGSLIALAPDGSVARSRGPVDAPMLPRSSVKPVQALASLRAGARLDGPALAIATGSHRGEDFHVQMAEEVLASAKLDAGALQCPPSWPGDPDTRTALLRSGAGPARIRMNCSGKHAGMLAACVAAGWPTESYREPGHPLQRLVRATLEEFAGERVAHTTVDGCGAPLFGISLAGLARSVQALVLAAPGSLENRVVSAMRAHPEYVGGSRDPNTALMRALPGVVAKGGAEGVLVVATAQGHTVAVKAIDGQHRGNAVAALAALARLGVDVAPAAEVARVPVLGGGEPVGAVRPVLD